MPTEVAASCRPGADAKLTPASPCMEGLVVCDAYAPEVPVGAGHIRSLGGDNEDCANNAIDIDIDRPATPCEHGRRPSWERTLLLAPRAGLLSTAPTLPPGPVAQLTASLAAVFEAEREALGGGVIDNRLPAAAFDRLHTLVCALMSGYATTAQDWMRFVAFNPHHYVRHLIDANEDFELLVLCWGPGQVSRVHNHASSHCWFALLDGEVEERRYRAAPTDGFSPDLLDVLGAEQPCPDLVPLDVATASKPGDIGYINDHQALHSVGCGPGAQHGAVTLHLYAPPIRRVQVYEPDEKRCGTRIPGFNTVRGTPT